MNGDCVHYKNVLVRSCGKKKVNNLTFQNVLSADAERTADAESMHLALIRKKSFSFHPPDLFNIAVPTEFSFSSPII